MRHLKHLYLVIGLAVLAVVVARIDVIEVGTMVRQVGFGLAAVVALYFAAFVIDSFTWQMALVEVPLDFRWLYRAWKVRMVGEVFNTVLPAAGMGGEPVKAVLLKKYYGIGYREGTASLILGKTINMVSLVLFLGIGFALMIRQPALSGSYKLVAGLGLAVFVMAILVFVAVQRYRITSIAGTWIASWPVGRRIDAVLHHIHDMDERLVTFYTRYRLRFLLAVVLAWINWAMGALEVYIIMIFLGHPISLADAWIIEAVTQLVRTGTFFIPGSIGVQEGSFLVLYAAITGTPALGVAVAVIRRLREILWLLWGMVLGWLFTLRETIDEGA